MDGIAHFGTVSERNERQSKYNTDFKINHFHICDVSVLIIIFMVLKF